MERARRMMEHAHETPLALAHDSNCLGAGRWRGLGTCADPAYATKPATEPAAASASRAVPQSRIPSQPAAPDPKREAETDKALHSPSGKAGKEEPGSHAPTDPSAAAPVLVDGKLTTPGAPKDIDTVPSKFSPRNAADDKLITTAYTFKAMPNDQRQAIFQALKDAPSVDGVKAEVGTELPVKVTLQAIPEQLARQVPQTEGYQYVVSDNRVLLVAPAHRVVVAVFGSEADLTTGAGGRVR